MKKIIIACLMLVPFLMAGCTSTEKGAVGGAAGGAALGALIGHATGGDAGKGALIGAAAGGITGAAVGSQHDQHGGSSHSPAGQRIQACPNGHNVDVSAFNPGAAVRCPACNVQFGVQ